VRPDHSPDLGDYVVLGMRIPGYILDPAALPRVTVPEVPAGVGVVLEGRAPLWLYVAVAQALQHQAPRGNKGRANAPDSPGIHP